MALIAIYVDAYPFKLHRLFGEEFLKRFALARIRPILGYTDCFKACLLTCKDPFSLGYWVFYKFRSQALRRRSLDLPLRLFDIPIIPFRVLRFAMSKIIYPVYNIPLCALGFLDFLDINPHMSLLEIHKTFKVKGFSTILSIFEDKGISYMTIEDRFFHHKILKMMKVTYKRVKERRIDFAFIYIDEPDYWGHRYGVDSGRYHELMRALTLILKDFISDCIKAGHNIIVFSDHGMASVRRYLDLMNRLLRDRSFCKSYVVGLDATMIRIKYLNERGFHESRWLAKLLNSYAHKLDEKDYELYRLPRDESYGDEVWLLKEGVCIFPNYFSWLRPRGMHAYDPLLPSQEGILLMEKGIAEAVNVKEPIEPWILGRLLLKATLGEV